MYADAAINFLKTTEHDNQPFMAFVSFTSPHDPRNILPDYGKKYSPAGLSVPDNFLPEHPFDNGELNIRDEQLLPVPRTPDQLKKELSLYYGMVSEVDLQIGRVIDALEESGNMDNTIKVCMSIALEYRWLLSLRMVCRQVNVQMLCAICMIFILPCVI